MPTFDNSGNEYFSATQEPPAEKIRDWMSKNGRKPDEKSLLKIAKGDFKLSETYQDDNGNILNRVDS